MKGYIAARFVHALWLGSGVFLLAVAAPAAFHAAPNSTAAADVVGAMLSRWHYIALIAPLAILAIDWRRSRVHVLLIVFIAILFAAIQGMADLRIRAIRASSPIPISELSHGDPLRIKFGRLHGISSVLLLAQVICAAAALGLDREAYPRRDDQPRAGDSAVMPAGPLPVDSNSPFIHNDPPPVDSSGSPPIDADSP